ncbi:MAG: 16S rRNA (adenine(1518)-N(6)/adenine(1519)-N(6))-dimethyltransferase RsmA [bacterium]|nr:16S rRNA (adenine(1518)-N(6)/adenine(1519)-N(6))-dimethyltransferase RsmA [bacterium]
MVKAKKSLGQNWLKNEQIVGEIVKAAKIKKGEKVLEVGPGQGVLTRALLDAGAQIVAVEKDDRLIDDLKQKFNLELANDRLEIIHHDILKFDPILINHQYKVVANLPYYITGEFIKKFLTTPNQPSLMVLMLQKEVAERIVARDGHRPGGAGKESVLSLSVKAYGTPKYVRTVARGNFIPAPKVDSAILLIENISKKLFRQNKVSETEFFTIIKKGFSSKRKQLKNNLKLESKLLAKYGQQRAEDLSLADWIKICVSK